MSWGLRLGTRLVSFEMTPDEDAVDLYAPARLRRGPITGVRAALSGYQDGRCAYCRTEFTDGTERSWFTVSFACFCVPAWGRAVGSVFCTVDRMTAESAGHPEPVELSDAAPQAREEAEIETTLAAHDEWVAAGCPGTRSHEDIMAELFGIDR
jgi:hypothetical protein